MANVNKKAPFSVRKRTIVICLSIISIILIFTACATQQKRGENNMEGEFAMPDYFKYINYTNTELITPNYSLPRERMQSIAGMYKFIEDIYLHIPNYYNFDASFPLNCSWLLDLSHFEPIARFGNNCEMFRMIGDNENNIILVIHFNDNEISSLNCYVKHDHNLMDVRRFNLDELSVQDPYGKMSEDEVASIYEKVWDAHVSEGYKPTAYLLDDPNAGRGLNFTYKKYPALTYSLYYRVLRQDDGLKGLIYNYSIGNEVIFSLD